MAFDTKEMMLNNPFYTAIFKHKCFCFQFDESNEIPASVIAEHMCFNVLPF